MSQLCEMVANKINAVLGIYDFLITGSNCSSSLCTDQRPNLLTHCVQFEAPHFKRNSDKTCSEKSDKDEQGTRN